MNNFFSSYNLIFLTTDLGGLLATVSGPPFYRWVKKRIKEQNNTQPKKRNSKGNNNLHYIDYCIDLNFLFVGLILIPFHILKVGLLLLLNFYNISKIMPSSEFILGFVLVILSIGIAIGISFLGPWIIDYLNPDDWAKTDGQYKMIFDGYIKLKNGKRIKIFARIWISPGVTAKAIKLWRTVGFGILILGMSILSYFI